MSRNCSNYSYSKFLLCINSIFLMVFLSFCKTTSPTHAPNIANLPSDVDPNHPVSLQYYEPTDKDYQFRWVTVKGRKYMIGTRIPADLHGVLGLCAKYKMIPPLVNELEDVFSAGEFREEHYKHPNSAVWTGHKPQSKPLSELGYILYLTATGNIMEIAISEARVYFICVDKDPTGKTMKNRFLK